MQILDILEEAGVPETITDKVCNMVGEWEKDDDEGFN